MQDLSSNINMENSNMSTAMATKNQKRKAERKMRVPLSCEPCRSRKLKCNREQPCQNCNVRQNPAGCIFRGSEKVSVAGTRPATANGVQQRIDRLENLVTSLIAQTREQAKADSPHEEQEILKASPWENGSIEGPVTEGIPTEVQHGMGVMTVENGGLNSKYRGTTHWCDVLKELNDLKSYWGQIQDDEETTVVQSSFSNAFDGPGILTGIIQPITMEEILASLPAKPAADKLMNRFFEEENSPVPTFHILHKPTFMKKYEAHYSKPKEAKVMWLALLFAVLSQTMLSYDICEDEPPEYKGISQSTAELYRLRTAQCLMLGDITKCAPYTLEALLYNTMSEWARKDQNEPRVWMMIGLLVRVGLQMGYHRDPSNFPNITIFQGEMRRRVWGFIHRSDSLTSFLLGLPSMIRNIEQDTAEPRNLYDWELTEDMTELPPSRPYSDITPASYLIIKGRMLGALGKIVDFLSSLGKYDYENVLKLDRELLQVYQEIPEYFKVPPRSDDGAPDKSPSLTNRRLQLEFLYLQGMCVLHRKFVAQGRSNNRFAHSRSRCIQSAIALLAQQHYLYVQTSKGAMAARHWYRVSYTGQEYILAAMSLVLELRQRTLENCYGDRDARAKEEGEILRALEKANIIWRGVENSPEAVKVYRVLSNMLGHVRPSSNLESGVSLQPQGFVPVPESDTQQVYGAPELGFQGDMDIDWSAWDSFIEGTSFEDVYDGLSSQQ